MPLGYRGIFQIPENTDAIQLASQEFRSWLESQTWAETHDWEGPGRFQIGPDAHLTVLEHTGDDGRRLLRLRVANPNSGVLWTTTLTAVAGSRRAREGDRIWIDVASEPLKDAATTPVRMTASVPRLARSILASTTVRDGLAEIGALPRIVRETDPLEIERLLEIITDPERHVSVVLSGPLPGLSVEKWRDLVSKLLRESVGLHAGYVLDEAAFAAINDRLPKGHKVPRAGLRTYLPGVDLNDSIDGKRHRVLSPQAITAGFHRGHVSSRLQWTLGHSVRGQALERPLPRDLRRADRILGRLETDTVLDSLGDIPTPATAELPAPPNPAATTLSEPARPPEATRLPKPVTEPTPQPEFSAVEEAEHFLLLREVLIEAVGSGETTSEAIQELQDLVRSAKTAERRQAELRAQLEEMREEVFLLEDERDQLKKEREDSQLDHAESEEELRDAQESLRWLRKKLVELNEAESAWTPVPEVSRTEPPGSFHELLHRLESGEHFAHIRFTGDSSHILELDARDPLGTWANKSWDALLALNDYARYRKSGALCEGVHAYLKEVPGGYHGYSANRHAATESQTVQAKGKWQQQRTLPVSLEVNPSGFIFMGAHFKIGAGNSISPRMHYHDDIAGTGLVYVGYLGRHLDTTQS